MPPPGGRNGYLTEEEKKNKPKVTKNEWKRELASIKTANSRILKNDSKNPYAAFMDDYLVNERMKRAESEYDEISKKLEYTNTQIKTCRKTLRFFLTDPARRNRLPGRYCFHRLGIKFNFRRKRSPMMPPSDYSLTELNAFVVLSLSFHWYSKSVPSACIQI